MTTIYIIMAVGAILLIVGELIYAPEGYEDEEGFHYGEKGSGL